MKNSKFKYQMSKLKKQRGFTLLELLVSISIIAVLVSLASVSYTNAQKKSRDARRSGDLKAVQNALEQYYANCGFVYPTLPSGTFACGTNTLLESIPVDPKSATPYPCSGCSAASYSYCASTEVMPTMCVKNLQ